MRKVLSFVLVLAMILGSVSMAFAATTLSDTKGATYEKAATALNELGVINGFTDGTFRGETNVTRGQYAAMVVRALGFDTTGSAVTGFKDVDSNSAYALAIKYGKELGIINGYSDGTFRPNENVTCDHAIAMLVRALGYKEEYLMGSFPTNCINQAMTLGILDGVATGSAASTRGNLAQLIYNALDKQIVTAYNEANSGWVTGASLITRLGYNDAYKGIWTTFDENFGAYGKIYVKKSDSTVKFFVPLSKAVTASWNKTDKVWEEADETAHYLTPVTTANSDAIYRDSTGALVGGITAPEFFYNGKAATVSYTIEGLKDIATNYTALTGDATVTFSTYKTSNGSEIVYAVSIWDGQNFQAEEDVQDDIAKAKLDGKSFTQLADKSIKAGTYFLNGVNALSEIKEDDIVTVYTAGSPAEITRVDVSAKTAEGTVTKTTATKYYIGADAYKVAHDGTAPVLGETGTAYLNYAGKVVVWDETETADSYAIVLAAQNADGADKAVTGDTAYVKLFLADGTTASYKFADKVAFEGAAKVAVNHTTTVAGVSIDQYYTAGKLVAYKLNSDNKITVIDEVAKTVDGIANYKVTKQNTISGYTVKDTAVVFVGKNLTTATEMAKASNWSIGSTDLVGKTITSGYLYGSKNVAKALVIAGTSVTSRYVVLNSVANYYDVNEKYGYEVEFLEAKEAKTVLAEVSATTGDVYKPTFDAAGNISSFAPVSANTTTTTAVKSKITVSADKTVVGITADATVATPAYTYYTVAADVAVYKFSVADNKYVLSSVSALKSLDAGTTISFYDVYESGAATTGATTDGIYDIVLVK